MNGVGRVVEEHGRQGVLSAPDDRRRLQGQTTSYPEEVGAGMYVAARTKHRRRRPRAQRAPWASGAEMTVFRRRYRPAYLADFVLQRLPDGRRAVVVRSGDRLPAHARDGQEEWPVTFGLVEPRAVEGHHVLSWGYRGSGAYRTAREGAECLVVHRVEGAGARQRFRIERADRRAARR